MLLRPHFEHLDARSYTFFRNSTEWFTIKISFTKCLIKINMSDRIGTHFYIRLERVPIVIEITYQYLQFTLQQFNFFHSISLSMSLYFSLCPSLALSLCLSMLLSLSISVSLCLSIKWNFHPIHAISHISNKHVYSITKLISQNVIYLVCHQYTRMYI